MTAGLNSSSPFPPRIDSLYPPPVQHLSNSYPLLGSAQSSLKRLHLASRPSSRASSCSSPEVDQTDSDSNFFPGTHSNFSYRFFSKPSNRDTSPVSSNKLLLPQVSSYPDFVGYTDWRFHTPSRKPWLKDANSGNWEGFIYHSNNKEKQPIFNLFNRMTKKDNLELAWWVNRESSQHQSEKEIPTFFLAECFNQACSKLFPGIIFDMKNVWKLPLDKESELFVGTFLEWARNQNRVKRSPSPRTGNLSDDEHDYRRPLKSHTRRHWWLRFWPHQR